MLVHVADDRKRATIEEVLRRSQGGEPVELIDGEIVRKATPTIDHGRGQARLLWILGGFDGGGSGPRGPGGWWVVTEVETLYPRTEEVFRHDACGWRRERVPTLPSGWPVRERPDWAAEILSPGTARYDVVKKQRTLHLHGVPYYWLLNPEHETLTVLRHGPEAYLQILTAGVGDVVRAEPFEAIEIVVAELFGHD